MENVPEAPIPNGTQWSEVLDAWEFGARQHRRRRFSSNLANLSTWLSPAPESMRHPDPWPTVTATEHKVSPGSSWRTIRARAGRKVGRRMTLTEMNEAFGLPGDFSTPALKNEWAYAVRGNGVPLEMGRALACAIRAMLQLRMHDERKEDGREIRV